MSLVPAALVPSRARGAALFRTIVLGGQQPPPDRPANTVVTYGMTETGSGVVYDGVALDGVEVRLDSGEVWLRGPMLLRCYRDGTDPKTADGWFADRRRRRARRRRAPRDPGPSGRRRDLGRGEHLAGPGRSRAARTPGRAEVAVGGVPDPDWGTRLVAYVVVSPGGEDLGAANLLAELRELVREQIAPFAAPRELVLVDESAPHAIGKVARAHLAGASGPAGALSVTGRGPGDDVFEQGRRQRP